MKKVIRVFISSTFEDMKEERATLMSKIFPTLVYEASLRGITLVPIDLRWGITQEEAENGKVIRTCLDEIDNSKPYFIGILGDRYGWQPDLKDLIIDKETLYKYPWLSDDICKHLSMTEIEMQYGVLRRKGAVNSAFYIKKNNNAVTEQRNLICKIEKYSQDNNKTLSYYSSVEELGNFVHADFMKMLERDYPLIAEKDSFLQENHKQGLYFNSHLTNLIARNDELQFLRAFLNTDKNSLAIFSPPGYGKTALLSYFINECKEKDNGELVVPYFLSYNNIQSNPEVVSDYIENYIRKYCDFELTSDSGLEKIFNDLARHGKKTVIVLDGIEHLSLPFDDNNAYLNWLPAPPSNVKYILSTNNKELFSEILDRIDESIELTPLSISNINKYIIQLTENASKHLEIDRISTIASDPKSMNLHMVDLLFHGLIYNCVFSDIDIYLSEYKKSSTADAFIDYIINRAMYIFRGNIVKRVLTCLNVSGYGLKENELIQFCQLSQFNWSQLWCANNFLFTQVGDRIALNRSVISENVLSKYVDTNIAEVESSYKNFLLEELKKSEENDKILSKDDILILLKISLGKRLDDREIPGYVSRIINSEAMFAGKRSLFNELIYQYRHSQNLDALFNLISNPTCFIYMTREYRYFTYSLLKHLSEREYSIQKLVNIKNEDTYSHYFLGEYYYHLATIFGEGLASNDLVLFCWNKAEDEVQKTDDKYYISIYAPIIKINRATVYTDSEKQFDILETVREELIQNKDSLSIYNYVKSTINSALALYEMKQKGRECMQLTNETTEEIVTRLEQSQLLLEGLDITREEYLEISCEIKRILANVKYTERNSISEQQLNQIRKLYAKAYDDSLELLKINYKKYTLTSIRILHDYALLLFEENLLEDARDKLEQGLDIFPWKNRGLLVEYDEVFAHLLLTLVQVCTNLLSINYSPNLYIQSLGYSNHAIGAARALMHIDEDRFINLYADVLYSKARLVAMRGRLEGPESENVTKAIGIYNESLQFFRQNQNRDKILQTCIAIGDNYLFICRYDMAVPYLEEGISNYAILPKYKNTLIEYIKALSKLKQCNMQLHRSVEDISIKMKEACMKLKEQIGKEEYNAVIGIIV